MTTITYISADFDTQSDLTVFVQQGEGNELEPVQTDSGQMKFQKSDYSIADIQDLGYEIGKKHPFAKLTVDIAEEWIVRIPIQTWVQWLSFGLSLAGYEYQHVPGWQLNPVIYNVELITDQWLLQKAHQSGVSLARSQAYSRELMNKPANILYPETFVSAVQEMPLSNVTIDVFDEHQMFEMGFGGLVGVSQGSAHKGQLLIVDYHPTGASQIIAIVGKGVTFDSGGISIKPPKFMSSMKFDMGGAAATIGAIYAIAEAQLPVRVVILCGLVENMPSGNALRPGDVVTMLSGKSVEIISTDAEGRMVLADVLHYAQHIYQPDYLIDIATLTGGAGVALGKGYSALMGSDSDFMLLVQRAGEHCAEPVWPMPNGGWFDTALKSDYADLRHGSEDPHGSPCVAATFLSHFVGEKQKWIHIDTAAMSHEMPHRRIYQKAASGYGALLLTHICQFIAGLHKEA